MGTHFHFQRGCFVVQYFRPFVPLVYGRRLEFKILPNVWGSNFDLTSPMLAPGSAADNWIHKMIDVV